MAGGCKREKENAREINILEFSNFIDFLKNQKKSFSVNNNNTWRGGNSFTVPTTTQYEEDQYGDEDEDAGFSEMHQGDNMTYGSFRDHQKGLDFKKLNNENYGGNQEFMGLVASSEKGGTNRKNSSSKNAGAIKKRSARKRDLEDYIEQELLETEEIFSKLGNLVNKI